MMQIVFSIIAFLLALGVLITVHEFGHYWVARSLGVKVLRFSIGFGRPLWKRVAGRDQTEYVIAMLPLGGYVKMLDEREAPVADTELHRAFNRQPPPRRMAIVAAGPLFNFLFAILAYWLMYMAGIPGIKPQVGAVAPDSLAAQAGMRAGDEILNVGGAPTPTWGMASLEAVNAVIDGERLVLGVRGSDGAERTVNMDAGTLMASLGEKDLLASLGLRPALPPLPAVIGKIEPGSPAAQAGLQAGDSIISADGQAVADWAAWVEYVRARPGVIMQVEIERGARRQTLALTPAAESTPQGDIGRIGVAPHMAGEIPPELRAEVSYSFFPALGVAVSKTWEMSSLTLRILAKMVLGEVSLSNLSGPVTIAAYAGQSAAGGWVAFLAFLGIVSVSLGVLNLMPIPLLDGGHLFYDVIEQVRGRPLSEQAQMLGQRVGMALLLMLMALALYNDLVRLLG